MLEINGVAKEAMNEKVRVVIRRTIPKPPLFSWVDGFVSRWVRVEEGLEVIEGAAMLWPDAARLKSIGDECKRKTKKGPAPLFLLSVLRR